MAILPVVTYNDAVLRNETTAVEHLTDDIVTLINDMIETMYNSDGVGLAAPQVGKSLRIFVMDGDPVLEDEEEKLGLMVFINPEIISSSDKKVSMDEGCLSIPEIREKVTRPDVITIKYRDINFEEHEHEFSGWLSRIIQHEYDHLEGVLFIDYLSAFRKRMIKKDLEEIDSGARKTEYPLVPKM